MVDNGLEDTKYNVKACKPFKLPCLLKYEDLMAKYSDTLEIRCLENENLSSSKRRSIANDGNDGRIKIKAEHITNNPVEPEQPSSNLSAPAESGVSGKPAVQLNRSRDLSTPPELGQLVDLVPIKQTPQPGDKEYSRWFGRFHGKEFGDGLTNCTLTRRKYCVGPGSKVGDVIVDEVEEVVNLLPCSRGLDVKVYFVGLPRDLGAFKVEHFELKDFKNGPLCFYKWYMGLSFNNQQRHKLNPRRGEFVCAMVELGWKQFESDN